MQTILKKTSAIIAILVCTVILSAVLVGCKNANKQPKIILIVADAFGDQSFYDSAKAGVQRLEKDSIGSVSYMECKGQDYDAKLRKVAKDAELVLAVGWEFETIGAVAAEYPDVKFVWADGMLDDLPENLICVTYAQNEGAFLAGYLAASLSESGKIGMVGGMENDVIRDFLTGYQQGVAYEDPDCEVMSAYIGDFENSTAAKDEALALAGDGCDVLLHAAGAAGTGVFEAAAEGGFYAIGVDSDQKYLDEDHIVASVVKDIGSSLYDVAASYEKDDIWDGASVLRKDLKSGHISLGYGKKDSRQQVSEELKQQVEKVAEQIKSGEITVRSTVDTPGRK